MLGDIKEHRPVANGQLHDGMSPRKQKAHHMTMLHQAPQILKDLAGKSPLVHFFLQDFKLVDEQNHPLSVAQHPIDVVEETAEDKGWVVIECFQPRYAHRDAAL